MNVLSFLTNELGHLSVALGVLTAAAAALALSLKNSKAASVRVRVDRRSGGRRGQR